MGSIRCLRLLLIVTAYLLPLFLPVSVGAFQEKGVPFVKNYTPAEYAHKGKIWDIMSAPNGIVYMAADKGLLEYDGEKWYHFKGSEGITRSLFVQNDSVIYTGSDLDFGVWTRNEVNGFEYSSLYPFREDLSEIGEEFWDLYQINGKLFFISKNNIYVYQDQNLTKIPLTTALNSVFQVNDQLYLLDNENVLHQLTDLAPKRLIRLQGDQKIEIAGAYEVSDGLMLVTNKEGLIFYDGQSTRKMRNDLSLRLQDASVFSFERIGEELLAFGTILNGLIIADTSGNILHYLNKNKGLQNNTILSLHYSMAGILWMGMDYGLSYVDLDDEYGYFYDYLGNFGTGYTAALRDSDFFLGSNQGLYKSEWSALNNSTSLTQFELLNGTEGQVWTLQMIEDELLMGHDRGLFHIDGDRVQIVNGQSGVWDMVTYRDHLLTGTYNGIAIYQKENGKWQYDRQMEFILGSCNQIILSDPNILWVNIPNFGVIRALLNDDLVPVEREIFRSDLFGGNDHLISRYEGEIMVRSDGRSYYFDPASKTFTSETSQEKSDRISDITLTHVMPVRLNAEYEFFPLYNGFALKKAQDENTDKEIPYGVQFRDVTFFNNKQEYNYVEGMEVSYSLNNIRFRMVVPQLSEARYQYRRKGEEEWSSWTDNNSINLVDLKAGELIIEARAMADGQVLPSEYLTVRVRTPWYISWYAVIAYLMITGAIFYLFHRWKNTSLDEQKKILMRDKEHTLNEQAERHKEELRRADEEKLKERIEQMKARLKSKTVELANKAKENEEKNKILKELKEKFRQLEQRPEALKSILRSIEQTLDTFLNLDDNTFEIQIDEMHQEFFGKLRVQFPDLTLYDLRLCAYLKLGLDTKEIANLLNIKPSSVYISRSRLRKKLDMGDDDDLHAYLNKL